MRKVTVYIGSVLEGMTKSFIVYILFLMPIPKSRIRGSFSLSLESFCFIRSKAFFVLLHRNLIRFTRGESVSPMTSKNSDNSSSSLTLELLMLSTIGSGKIFPFHFANPPFLFLGSSKCSKNTSQVTS